MENITPFNFDTVEVRTGEINGIPVWIGKDVCEALEISKYRDALAKLDSDERASISVDTLGGPQEMTAITESGIYGLLLIAPASVAVRFRRWLKHEVLPAIRKTGSYSAPKADWVIPQTMPEALRLAATALEALEIAKPKVAFYDAVVADANWFTLQKAAAELKIPGLGRTTLFQFLRDWEILTSDNVPYRRFIDSGYFCQQPVRTPVGVKMQTMVSQKGVDFILRQWNKHSGAVAA